MSDKKDNEVYQRFNDADIWLRQKGLNPEQLAHYKESQLGSLGIGQAISLRDLLGVYVSDLEKAKALVGKDLVVYEKHECSPEYMAMAQKVQDLELALFDYKNLNTYLQQNKFGKPGESYGDIALRIIINAMKRN